MSESVLKKFGKYFLLDQIGEGGMAEIFRARGASLDSSGRFIVIKRIQGAFSNNPEFVQMFRSEVQVTMRFAHPNIVQLYEAGEENGQQFIAMELVDGRNVRQILSRMNHKKQNLPVPAACYIVEQTAAGLHYAHVFKDRITGESLNLVHRDVSPQNILVSYDGNIKVIDFGIAKATTNGEATRAGVIKGKLSYLSPEQVMGETLDGRSDIFALGIVLWELLTGKKLFVAEGENEFQVLKMIESCNTFVKPPSSLNPDVPPELDKVVMQALTRDTKKRFQSAEEMARALRKVLATRYSDFGPSDLSIFIKKLFQDLIVEDRKQLQQVNARAEELIKLGTNSQEITQTHPYRPGETRIANFIGDKFDKSQLSDADQLEVTGQPQRQMKVPAAARPQSAPTAQASHARPSPAKTIPTPVVPEDTSKVGSSKWIVGVAALGALGFFGFQHYRATEENDAKSAQIKTHEAQQPGGAAVSKGALHIRLFPDGNISKTRVTVNSQVLDLEKGTLDIPVGEPLELIVERPGFITYRKEFTVKEDQLGSSRDYALDVKLEPMIYGTISISTRPSVADVQIINLDQGTRGLAQEPVTLKTPVYQEKLPAGNYKVVVKNEVLGVEKSFQVEVREGKETVFADLQLDSK